MALPGSCLKENKWCAQPVYLKPSFLWKKKSSALCKPQLFWISCYMLQLNLNLTNRHDSHNFWANNTDRCLSNSFQWPLNTLYPTSTLNCILLVTGASHLKIILTLCPSSLLQFHIYFSLQRSLNRPLSCIHSVLSSTSSTAFLDCNRVLASPSHPSPQPSILPGGSYQASENDSPAWSFRPSITPCFQYSNQSILKPASGLKCLPPSHMQILAMKSYFKFHLFQKVFPRFFTSFFPLEEFVESIVREGSMAWDGHGVRNTRSCRAVRPS